jgi:ABC-type sulfate transport system substrate-binding protein
MNSTTFSNAGTYRIRPNIASEQKTQRMAQRLWKTIVAAAAVLLIGFMPAFTQTAQAANVTIDITGKTYNQIDNELKAARTQSVAGDVITITGAHVMGDFPYVYINPGVKNSLAGTIDTKQ